MPQDWYITFLNQAAALKKTLGNNKWKYGWYDGGVGWARGKIEDDKVSYIMGKIWDTFTDAQKKIFGGQKILGIQQMYLLLIVNKKKIF